MGENITVEEPDHGETNHQIHIQKSGLVAHEPILPIAEKIIKNDDCSDTRQSKETLGMEENIIVEDSNVMDKVNVDDANSKNCESVSSTVRKNVKDEDRSDIRKSLTADFHAEYAFHVLKKLGKHTGMVIHIMENLTTFTPIVIDNFINNVNCHLPLGSTTLTNFCRELLLQKSDSVDGHSASQIKRKYCYVANDFDKEYTNYMAKKSRMARLITECKTKNYALPNGEKITVGEERVLCLEALFKPHLVGIDCPGFDQMIHDCIKKCSIDNRKDLYGNIILTGDDISPGTAKRIMKSLEDKVPKSVEVCVTALSDESGLIENEKNPLKRENENVTATFVEKSKCWFENNVALFKNRKNKSFKYKKLTLLKPEILENKNTEMKTDQGKQNERLDDWKVNWLKEEWITEEKLVGLKEGWMIERRLDHWKKVGWTKEEWMNERRLDDWKRLDDG